jgi:hypothetical protein
MAIGSTEAKEGKDSDQSPSLIQKGSFRACES